MDGFKYKSVMRRVLLFLTSFIGLFQKWQIVFQFYWFDGTMNDKRTPPPMRMNSPLDFCHFWRLSKSCQIIGYNFVSTFVKYPAFWKMMHFDSCYYVCFVSFEVKWRKNRVKINCRPRAQFMVNTRCPGRKSYTDTPIKLLSIKFVYHLVVDKCISNMVETKHILKNWSSYKISTSHDR